MSRESTFAENVQRTEIGVFPVANGTEDGEEENLRLGFGDVRGC